MNIIEKYDTQFAYSSVILNLTLVVQAYLLWINPSMNDADKIYTIAILSSIEFFMIHSGVFMAVFPKKVSLYIFFPLYGSFALMINSMADGNDILYLYLIVVFQRMRFAFSDVKIELKNKAVTFSIYAAIIWLFVIALVLINKDSLPILGLNEDYLLISGYREKKSIGDLTNEPHLAMAFAMIYYLCLAFTEFNLTKSLIKNPKRFNEDFMNKKKLK